MTSASCLKSPGKRQIAHIDMQNNLGKRFILLFLSTRWHVVAPLYNHVSCTWFRKAIFCYAVTYLALASCLCKHLWSRIYI